MSAQALGQNSDKGQEAPMSPRAFGWALLFMALLLAVLYVLLTGG